MGKSGLKADSSLAETIRVIGNFLMPGVEAIVKQDRKGKLWPAGGPWNENRKNYHFHPPTVDAELPF